MAGLLFGVASVASLVRAGYIPRMCARWLVVVLLLGCAACGSSEAASPPPTVAETPTPAVAPEPGVQPPTTDEAVEAAAPTTAPSPSGLDTATACARARPCCAAFVDAIGDPVEAERARIACEQMDHLEELGQASGEACVAAIDGWRRTLEQAEREIPTACR